MNEDKNVKVVQDAYAAFQRGDVPGIIANMSESIVFTVPGSTAVPNSGVRRGHQGMTQFFKDLSQTTDFTLFEPREYIAQGNRVVALIRYEGRNRATGRNFAADSTMIWTVENGKITRFQEYTDTEALAAAAASGGSAAGAH